MQRRKNKYQRDIRGYIIEDARNDATMTTQEQKERKDNVVKGKGDTIGKEHFNVPVTISNKFILLEKGEVEIQRQVKK